MIGRKAVLGGVLAAAMAVTGTVALAMSHEVNPAVKARKGMMDLQVFNVGILVQMVQGKTDYDAAAAKTAADNLAAIVATDWTAYFPPGTAVGETDGTHALPKIWSDMATFNEDHKALITATAAMAEVAGNSLDALKGAIGPVGKACGTCHKSFRESLN